VQGGAALAGCVDAAAAPYDARAHGPSPSTPGGGTAPADDGVSGTDQSQTAVMAYQLALQVLQRERVSRDYLAAVYVQLRVRGAHHNERTGDPL